MGDSDIPSIFMSKMLRNLGTKSTLMYDVNSFSSYFQLINLLEYGYNRDDSDLPQLNLFMIVDKIEAHGMENYTMVMDRGFFSKGNIEELVREKILFSCQLQWHLVRISSQV